MDAVAWSVSVSPACGVVGENVRYTLRSTVVVVEVGVGAVVVVVCGATNPLSRLIVALPVTIWRLSRRLGWDRDLSTIDFLVCVTMAVIITALMWTLAHRFAVGWVRRHRERVREYLLDVERG